MFGKRAAIGLDIGADSVKWLAAEVDGRRVRRAWHAQLMPERTERAESLEGEALEETLRSLLRDCQRGNPLWSRGVQLSVQGTGALCGYMELPPLSPEELRVAVPGRVGKLIPFPASEVALSFAEVPPLAPGGGRSTLFYAAIRKDLLERGTAMLKRLGLEVKRVEVVATALARELFRNRPEAADEMRGIVHAGFRHTHVVLTRGGVPYAHRQFPLAGADFTYAFQMGAQIPWREAEEAKRACDVGERPILLEPFIKRWTGEIAKTLSGFTAQMGPAAAPARLVMSGGTALLRGLPRRLSEDVGLPCEVDGWQSVQAPDEASTACLYKAAAGMALADA